MTYDIQTKDQVVIASSISTLGKAIEKAVEQMQYMEAGSELIIVNDIGLPSYSLRFISYTKFEVTILQ